MKEENVLEVLLYLFEHYFYDDPDAVTNHDAMRRGPVAQGLSDAGFSNSEIQKAFDWLDDLASQRPAAEAVADGCAPVRVYVDQELARLDPDCIGFLMFLEQHRILDGAQRELVLDRLMALEQEHVDLDDLKWVVLMVLFNQPGSEAAFAWVESQLYFDEPEPLH